MKQQKSPRLGIPEVVREGFCIGCGACTAQSAAATINRNEYGELVADIQDCNQSELERMNVACPFSDAAPNETELARAAFGQQPNIRFGEEVGVFTGLYAGYSDTYRKWGSSGGIVSWLLSKMLNDGLVDKVIVVGQTGENDRFFDFRVVDKTEDLSASGTSFYYPVSFDRVLQYVIDHPGRYAVTGVPCFHKALRQLKANNPLIAERVLYQVGIVCGQMKSSFYLDYLSRKTGMDAMPVAACFRRKDESSRADDYLFEATYRNAFGIEEIRSVRNREIGASWAMGLFKPRACDFCDDVFAETADIAVMDAWLDRYVHDGKGTSLVVTRSNALQSLLEAGRESGELLLETVSEDDIIESQRGGLNHRRVGLRYRLFLDGQQNPVPRKRVHPSKQLDIWFKIEQRIRSAIREKSRLAMRRQLKSGLGGLEIYESEMKHVLSLFKWFSRLRNRLAPKRDYKQQFRLDC